MASRKKKPAKKTAKKATKQFPTNQPISSGNTSEQETSSEKEQSSMEEETPNTSGELSNEFEAEKEELSDDAEAKSGVVEQGSIALQDDKELCGKKANKKKHRAGKNKKKKNNAHDEKLNGITTDMDGETLDGDSIPEKSMSEPTSDTDTTASLPLTKFMFPALQEIPAIPGCFPEAGHELGLVPSEERR